MKKFLAVLLLIAALLALSGCELTLSKTTTEYDKSTNTIKRTTTILPDLDQQLESIFGK